MYVDLATQNLVAQCSAETFLFSVNQQEPTSLQSDDDAVDEQIFVCLNLQFVKHRNGIFSLHTENDTQTGAFVSFPHEMIHRGHCLIVNNQYIIFFAILVDGQTLLTNFTSTSYHQQLGVSEHAMYIPPIIKNQIGLVHSGSETMVYILSTPCSHQDLKPAIIIPNNFILASYFSTGTRDQCSLCPVVTAPDPTPTTSNSPVTPPIDIMRAVVFTLAALIACLILTCFIYKLHS